MQQPERERLIEDLVQRYHELLKRQLEREPQTIDEIEQLVEDVSVEMDRELEQRILDGQAEPPENQARCPDCGGTARYRGRYARLLITRHGERTFSRRYFYCAAYKAGFAPLERRLGLDAGATTPTVREYAARLPPTCPLPQRRNCWSG